MSTKLVSVGPFHVSLKHESLCVVSIPPELVATAAWWLVREYCLDERDKGGAFSSLLLDDDGLSIVCSPLALSVLENLLQSNPAMVVSPSKWKAFIITVVGWELPGAVYYLADLLSQEGMSILHISTFDSEVFLVQEPDVDRACAVLRRTENIKELENLRASKADRDAQQKSAAAFKEGFELKALPGNFFLTKLSDTASLASCSAALTRMLLFDPRYSALERGFGKARADQHQYHLLHGGGNGLGQGQGAGAGQGQGQGQGQGDLLVDGPRVHTVSPPQPPLADANANSNANANANASASSLSSPSSSFSSSSSSSSSSTSSSSAAAAAAASRPATFMWGLWQCGQELTLLLEESDLERFPEGALVVSPQRWKVIKLSGRPIEFDETGVVSAMTSWSALSSEEGQGMSLNISTATTNCSLVPEELLGQTLESLGEALQCVTGGGRLGDGQRG